MQHHFKTNRNLYAEDIYQTKLSFFALNEEQFAIACGEACAIVAPRQTASTDFIVRKRGSLQNCTLALLSQILHCNMQASGKGHSLI